MPIFAVLRSRGPAWDDARALDEQQEWRAHADFMDALYDEGFALLVGPLEGTREALLIVQASDAEEVRNRLARDPWSGHLLTTTQIARWTLRLGSLDRSSPPGSRKPR